MPLTTPSIQEVRAQFPGLAGDYALLENAGGSQVPEGVISEVSRFFREDYVQTYAGYPASDRATAVLHDAHEFLNLFFNGGGLGSVAIGQSATALLSVLGACLGQTIRPGDEVVVAVANHESNVGPWVRLEALGAKIRWWDVDKETGRSEIEGLKAVLSERTKIVVFPMTCNLTGDRVDPKAVADLARSMGAVTVVDCVAAAPHEALDVAAWGVDYCVFSAYKVYGPHFGALWGRQDQWDRLKGPNHFFLGAEGAKPFELGCQAYELLAGFLKVRDYFSFLAGSDRFNRPVLEAAYDVIARFEEPLSRAFLEFVESEPRIKLWGPRLKEFEAGERRHPTFGFTVEGMNSKVVSDAVIAQKTAIRNGHMYAYRLCESLGIDLEDGVVRLSAVHYNTVEEVSRACDMVRNFFVTSGARG